MKMDKTVNKVVGAQSNQNNGKILTFYIKNRAY